MSSYDNYSVCDDLTIVSSINYPEIATTYYICCCCNYAHNGSEPAQIDHDAKQWFYHGIHHRENGPAIERADGHCEWYIHGKRHREDGPAIIRADGSYEWYFHGIHHRENGPAIKDADGHCEWYIHGKRHREDGPAVIRTNGTCEWYIHGELHREDGPAIKHANGNYEWYSHGELHREDGPAIKNTVGRLWYFHGELHREDGPAVKNYDGHHEWYIHGELHREDGPAIEHANGILEWYVHNIRTEIMFPPDLDDDINQEYYMEVLGFDDNHIPNNNQNDIQNDPILELLAGFEEADPGSECGVCFDACDGVVVLPCPHGVGHIFGRSCLINWWSTKSKFTCPVCRHVHGSL